MSCPFCRSRSEPRPSSDLHRFLRDAGSIKPREQTRCCPRHQRRLSKSIKTARELGLVDYTRPRWRNDLLDEKPSRKKKKRS